MAEAAAAAAVESDGRENRKREEIEAAIAKAVELRALHAAAVLQGNVNISSPQQTHLRIFSPPPPPLSRPPSLFSAHDYPVFTPSYEDEPSLPGYHAIKMENQTVSESWDDNGLTAQNVEQRLRSRAAAHSSSRRRKSLGDFKSVSSYTKCKHDTSSTLTDTNIASAKNAKHSNIVVPLTDSHVPMTPNPKSKGQILSWLFPKFKKKNKNESSPVRADSDEVSQVLKDFQSASIKTLKRELIEANQKRDEASMEVAEMRSSFGELKQKLEQLEVYCEELKRALREAVHTNSSRACENAMPVSEEAMIEGFLQIVSESRLSVKQFCKTLVRQIEDTDGQLVENLNLLLKSFKLSVNSKYSKLVLYHLEAIINQAFYQDFENCVFQKNGCPKQLNPQQDQEAQFSSFVALRNLSWNEVLKKGTKYYSEEFSKFCDQKMSCIITTLNWTTAWPEQLLQSFFVAAKCVWLLHLLAFSFHPPLTILRVEENRHFDPHYMDDIFMDKQRTHSSSRVKIMVMPGFYVKDRILRCKVLCRYKSVT